MMIICKNVHPSTLCPCLSISCVMYLAFNVYFQSKDPPICFVYMVDMEDAKITNMKTDSSHLSKRFTDWKNATTKFKKYKHSKCQRETVERNTCITLSEAGF